MPQVLVAEDDPDISRAAGAHALAVRATTSSTSTPAPTALAQTTRSGADVRRARPRPARHGRPRRRARGPCAALAATLPILVLTARSEEAGSRRRARRRSRRLPRQALPALRSSWRGCACSCCRRRGRSEPALRGCRMTCRRRYTGRRDRRRRRPRRSRRRSSTLLALLVRRGRCRGLARATCMRDVWRHRLVRRRPKTVDMHVSTLRRKLAAAVGDPDPQRFITTVRGVGFRLRAGLTVRRRYLVADAHPGGVHGAAGRGPRVRHRRPTTSSRSSSR